MDDICFIIVIQLLFLLCVACFSGIYYLNLKSNRISQSQVTNVVPHVFQGPVRPTDDETYFRKTGITRPLEVKE